MTKRKTIVLDSYPFSWLKVFPLILLLLATQQGRRGRDPTYFEFLFSGRFTSRFKRTEKQIVGRVKTGILICKILVF